MSNPVDVSTAGPGEIADVPAEDDIFNTQLRNTDGEKSGFLVKWRTSIGAYVYADKESHVSLDSMM